MGDIAAAKKLEKSSNDELASRGVVVEVDLTLGIGRMCVLEAHGSREGRRRFDVRSQVRLQGIKGRKVGGCRDRLRKARNERF